MTMTEFEEPMLSKMQTIVDKILSLGAKPRIGPINWLKIEAELKVPLRPEHKWLLEQVQGFNFLNFYSVLDPYSLYPEFDIINMNKEIEELYQEYQTEIEPIPNHRPLRPLEKSFVVWASNQRTSFFAFEIKNKILSSEIFYIDRDLGRDEVIAKDFAEMFEIILGRRRDFYCFRSINDSFLTIEPLLNIVH